jgi:hypothetical protein
MILCALCCGNGKVIVNKKFLDNELTEPKTKNKTIREEEDNDFQSFCSFIGEDENLDVKIVDRVVSCILDTISLQVCLYYIPIIFFFFFFFN